MVDQNIQKEAQIIADTLCTQHNGDYKKALEQIEDEIRHAIHTGDSREQSIWELTQTIVKASMLEDSNLDFRLFKYDESFVGSKSRSRTMGQPNIWAMPHAHRFYGRD